jgi:branched-chain amino acid transport system substrate-binding protein
MRTLRLSASVVALLLAALLLGSCKASSTFGFSTSLTGANADLGKYMRDGYQFWAETVNQKGGLKVNGQSVKVALKYYDDESNANTAASNVQKLISQDHVDFILGPYGSPTNLTAVVVTEKNHYILLDTEGAANDLFSKGYHYIVGNVPLATAYPPPALDFLATQNPKPKLAVVWADDSFSKLVGPAMIDQAKAKGFDVVVQQQYPTGLTDFSPLITQMKSAGADVVFGAGHSDEALNIVKQEQQLNYHPAATIQTVGPSTPAFAQSLGPAAEGQFGVASWTSNITSFKDDLFGDSANYAANFKKQFGYDPDYHSPQASAGAEILGLAIEKAGSIDQDKVLTALHQLDVMTVGGPFKADSTGANQGAQMLLGQIQNGTFVAVWPDKYASAKPRYPAK